MIILEFFLDFLVFPIIFVFIFLGSLFSINIFTIFLLFILFFLLYFFYIKTFKYTYKLFFLIALICIIISMIGYRFCNYGDLLIISFIISPFEIISLIGIIIGILIRKNENKKSR